MIRLFVSTFGQNADWIKNGIPIEVGAANRQEVRYEVRDDIGDNISDENPYWGELTGLYWIWKNEDFQPDDIIGFCHYNKCLQIEMDEVSRILGTNSKCWIAKEPVKIVPHDYQEDITALESVLRGKYKEYFLSWERLYDSNGASKNINCCSCELFFAKRDEFYSYCEFLFGVLFEVKRIIGDVDRVPYHKRYLAFLGERLLSVYLLTGSKTVHFAALNPYRKPISSVIVKIKNMLHINSNSRFYREIKKLFLRINGRQSSYLQ